MLIDGTVLVAILKC